MTRVDTRGRLLSYRAIVLENRALRAVVLPELGGRIWSIVYKPRDRELLWQNPRIPPAKAPFGAPFDDVWCGGWEEMFPTASPGTINGESYPDHGEVWCLAWDWDVQEDQDGVELKLRTTTPTSAVAIEKHFTLVGDAPQLQIAYRLENLSRQPLPHILALHPAWKVTPACRLDLPPMRFDLDPSFLGTLTDAEPSFHWPFATRGGKPVDLSAVHSPSSGDVFFIYGHDFRDGWLAITDSEDGTSWGLKFDAEFLRSCWIFATYGGWRDYYTLLVEPSTAYPSQIELAIESGRAPVLGAHQSVETTVRFQVQEGLSQVGGLGPEGEFVE